MGRYIGPVEKLERREGVSLDLKGKRQLLGKTSLERRGPTPPGQHGAPSVYGQQLRESQKLKIAYGIREKQMRRLIDRARRNHETTAGEARCRCWSAGSLAGRILRAPQRDEIAMPVTEQLVIERYARR